MQSPSKNPANVNSETQTVEEAKICGIVRPISASSVYSSQHWEEVGQIIDDAVQGAGYEPRLVSDGDSSGIIHARIVANLYRDPVVVCDISGKNPNVMLELGMRLAFDKPVVVIKDDNTEYSFDTSPIEHLTYPSSLHYPSITLFKERLTEKVIATCESFDASKSFLRQFGPIKVAEISEERVPGYELVREELRELRALILSSHQARSQLNRPTEGSRDGARFPILKFKKKLPVDLVSEVTAKASQLSGVDNIKITITGEHMIVLVKPDLMGGWDQHQANDAVRGLLRGYLNDIPLPKS